MRYVWAVENWEKSTNKNNIRTEELSPSQIIVNDLKLKIEKPNTWPLHAVIKDRFLNFLSLLNKMDKKALLFYGNMLEMNLSQSYDVVYFTTECQARAKRVRHGRDMNDASATQVRN